MNHKSCILSLALINIIQRVFKDLSDLSCIFLNQFQTVQPLFPFFLPTLSNLNYRIVLVLLLVVVTGGHRNNRG